MFETIQRVEDERRPAVHDQGKTHTARRVGASPAFQYSMAVLRTSFLRRAALVVLGVALAAPGTVAGQPARDSALIYGNGPQPGSPLRSWGDAMDNAANGGPLLDSPVSRTAYQLGPGDVVTVALFGDLNQTLTTVVTPEGSVLIPTVGIVPVLGLNLDQAQSRVGDLIYQYYRNVTVDLTLTQVRSFKVFVVGNVSEPGVRAANASTRVSEVVPVANAAGTVHRNIRVRRSAGDSIVVDLARFFQTGDLTHNPTLNAGDAIVVPSIDETITVTGRVTYPGTYEYRTGDTLAELLWIANGASAFPADAGDSVRIARFVSAHEREFLTLPREAATGAAGRQLQLTPFDAIYVSAVANYKAHRSATIRGEVRRPGTYPIRPDTTTVQDLVAMAGGFTADASLIDAVLRRARVNSPLDSLRLLQNVPPEFLSREDRQLLRVTSRGDEENVVVDFEELFSDGVVAHDQTLRDGDLMYIPPRRNSVVVLGAVVQPGILSFAPGDPISSYVARAGGFTRSADRGDMVVLKAKLGNRIDAEDVRVLEPGDRIIVPFKEPRTFVERIQTVQGVVSTVSGFVVTIIGLERLWDAVR